MANGGRINYTIGFSVDTQGALKTLERTLTDIQVKAQSSGTKMKQGYQESAETAKQLSKILDQSYNKDLGTINVNRFNEALQKSNLNLQQVQSSLAKVPEGARAYNLLAGQILKTNIQLKQTNKWLDEMAISMANTVRWGVTSSIFNAITSSISKAYSYSKQLNSSLTDIRIVTGKTADEMDRFAESANRAAKNLATSTTNYTNASLIYYQQGLSDEEVKARTETTIKAANVTGQSADEVSEQLTAVWNGYKVSAQEAELYIDKLAAVAATTAADLEELSTGMSKVASAANIMGVDIDQLNAQLATVVSVTRQAPESVGTAFKTIYARMGDIEAGLDTETSLGEYTKKMNEMGFNVLDTNGKLRDMGSVIEEIGNKWQNLSREQQVALSQVMAGTRQYNNLLALFDNWDMYQDALNTSASAAGTLQQQQDIYFESAEAHLDVLKATWEDLYAGLVDSDELNMGIDLITQLAQTVDNFFDSFGGGIKSIAAFGAIVANIFNKQISSAIANAIMNQDKFNQNIALLKFKEQAITGGAISISPDASAQDQAIYAGLEKQIQYAEKIKSVKAGITSEEYNQLTALQQQIGALVQEATLIEETALQEAQKLGLSREKLLSEEGYIDSIYEEVEIAQISAELTQKEISAVEAQLTSTKDLVGLKFQDTELSQTLLSVQSSLTDKIDQQGQKASDNLKVAKQQLDSLIDKTMAEKDALKSEEKVRNLKKQILELMQKINAEEKKNIQNSQNRANAAEKVQNAASKSADIKSQAGVLDAEFEESMTYASRAASVAEKVTTVSTTMSTLVMSWSSVNMMFQTWGDESASLGDKIIQTFMTLGMVIPSVLNSFKNLNATLGYTTTLSELHNLNLEKKNALLATQAASARIQTQNELLSNILLTAQEKLQKKKNLTDQEALALEMLKNGEKKKAIAILGAMTPAQLKEIGLNEAMTNSLIKTKLAQDGLNASMLANPALLIIAALGGVVAILATVTNSIKKAREEQIQQTKEKVEEIKATQKQIETNKELVKTYSDLVNQYEEQQITKQELYDKTVELVSAYGTEINVLDILAGKYDNVKKAIIEARQAELEGIISDSKAILKEYDYSYDATFAESGLISRGDTNWLNLGYAKDYQAQMFLNALEETSAFGKAYNFYDISTPSEIEVYGDFSTKEGFIKNYRDIKLAYETAMEKVGEEVYSQTEVDNTLYQWLQDNKEYVETLENEQKIIKDAQAEMKAYDINFEDTNSLYDFRKQYDELYEYIRENNPELNRKRIDEQVKDLIKSTSTQGEAWLTQNQAYEDLIEKFDESNEQKIVDMVGSLSEEEFQAFFTLNIDEITSLEQVESYIQRAKYLVEKEKITLKIETSQDVIDSLFEGKDLTKDQITSLQELEKEYEKLGVIQDRTSTAYLEKLIQIREELEQEKIQNQINIRNLAIEETQDIVNVGIAIDPDKERELQNKLKEIVEQDYQVIVEVKADWQSDFNSVTTVMENMESIASKIGENFIVAAEDVEELNQAFPGILAGIEYLNDGTVQLNQEAVKAAMDASKREASADTLATVEKLENERVLLESKRDAALDIAKMAESIAQGDSKVADVQGDINKALNTLKIKNSSETAEAEGQNNQEVADSAAISAENMTQNFATAYEAMAADSQKFAEIAKHNFEVATTGQGDTISPWGYTFNTQWKATKNEDIGTVATADAGNLNNYDDVSQIENWQEVADYYYSLADSYNAASNENLGKQAELVARNNAFLTSMTNIGSGTGKEGEDSNQIDLLDDKIDRYHDINILLDDMAKKIERVNRAQEHLVGADWLAAQEQGLKLLEEEIELRRKKQEIQQAEAVELQGHLLADGVKFFDDGSVANYAEIMIAQLAKANQAKMSGNEDVADAAEKNYEAFKENFERYEELRDDIEDLADEITDMMYEQISKKVEAFTAKLTVELDTTQAQKEWKEFTNQLFISANNALAQITAQSEIYSANRNIATQTTGKYEQIVNEGIKAQSLVEGTAEEGTTSVYAQWSEELQQYIFDQAKWQEDMQASQQEAQEAILQILDDVDALGETAIGLLEDTIAAQKEQLAIYDDMNSLLNHSLKLQELFTGEKDYDAKGRIYAEQATISDQKARDAATRRNYALSNIDTYAQAYNEAKQKYDEAVANGTGDVTVLEKQLEITKQAYEDMKNELKESTDDFYSSIEEQIEAAKNVYVNTINKAMADMEKMFTGGKGLSYINEEWDLINKNAERYLDTVNSTYEVQALESKYIKAMDSTSNLSTQKKINKVMEEELKALREKDKLSQYDIDRANKKYELTMKQIALEEAQANKSTMRLRRDAQGNYSYQFVADEDEVSDAQQDLLAAQNDLYNFDKERYQQTLDDILSIYQEYQQKMLEAAQINDPIARAEQEKLITEQYQQLMLAIAADNETAKQNLGMSTTEALQGQYDINRSNFEAITQGIFDNFSSVEEGMSTNFEMIMSNMITGWSGSVQSMIDKIAGDGPDGFKQQSQNAFNIAQQAAQEFDNKLIEIGENFSGEGNTADRILSDVQEINDKLDSFKTNVLDPTLAAVQTLIPDVWAEYKSGVDLAAESMSTLATKISSVYTNADSLSKKLINIASQSPINVEIKYKTTGDATNPSGGYPPNGGGGKGISSQTSSQIGDTVVWGGDYALLNQDVNNGNKMTNTSKTWNDIWDALDENEQYDWDDAHWDGGDDEVLAYAFPKWKITQEIYKDDKVYLYLESERDSSIGGWIPEEDLEEFSKSSEGWSYKTQSFDTGGYTGEWGSEGRMAMLHEKEIVLNQTDTANILDAVAIVRGIGDMLASLQSNWLSNLSSVQVPTISNSETNNSTAQTVNITAEFPNASSATEIEKALKNLVNIASQRAQAFK